MKNASRSLLGFGVIVVACGGPASGDHGTAGSGLASSQDLASALAGKVVSPPPNATGIAAATRGSAEVTDSGATTYHVPIWVPDGINGMTPSLSINYNSVGGYGLLGPKWDLAGLSVITRCKKSVAHNGTNGPVDFRGDTFCRDGHVLHRFDDPNAAGAVVPMPNIAPSAGTSEGDFFTEENPYEGISATAADDSGVLSFQVLEPDGRILYYGSSADSRLSGNPTTFPVSYPDSYLSEAYYAYYLDKISDRFGNTILIKYQNQITTFSSEAQELAPSLIQWGGVGDTAGLRSVQFNYQAPAFSPSDPGADRSRERWVSGLGIVPAATLSSIVVSGPGSSGAAEVLKTYNLGYSAPSVTAATLLYSITECDASNVCKRPTTVQWETGSLDFNRVDFGITDVALPEPPPRSNAISPEVYKRILVADLNHDGRDDIVYRAPVTMGAYTCLGWAARLSAGTSFGDLNPLALGTDPDIACITIPGTNTTPPPEVGYQPYTGDLVIADVNRDGFPDVLSPVGGFNTGKLNGVGYNLYLNNNTYFPQDPVSDHFGLSSNNTSPIHYEGPSVDGNNPQVSVGDTNGDGQPEVLRPMADAVGWGAPKGTIWAAQVNGNGVTSSNSFPGTEASVMGFSVVDVDGDGTLEILRDLEGGGTMVNSPTLNGMLTIPGSNADVDAGQPPQTVRWFLDWNGDGLQDVAYVDASDPFTVITAVNTGRGFFTAATTKLPPSTAVGQAWRDLFESGVRVADYNLDGRDDLILVDNGALPIGPDRWNVVALLSNADGTFRAQTSSIPIGDSADGFRPEMKFAPRRPKAMAIAPRSSWT